MVPIQLYFQIPFESPFSAFFANHSTGICFGESIHWLLQWFLANLLKTIGQFQISAGLRKILKNTTILFGSLEINMH